mgnify:CR=1 FL=1
MYDTAASHRMLPDLPFRASASDDESCDCVTSFDRPVGTGVDDRVVLTVDATACSGRGDLAASPSCLATVVGALAERDADVLQTRCSGVARTDAGRAAASPAAPRPFHEPTPCPETPPAALVRHQPVCDTPAPH